MFKKSFLTAITVVSLSVSNVLAQSIEIPNMDEKNCCPETNYSY